jgi:arginase family enzyme
VIDPLERWREFGEKPDYAGLLTYGTLPYTQDPAELAGADVAIVGAPMDDLVSDRPGARFGPRAIRAASCPPGSHLEAGVDAMAELRMVDYGDAPVLPADAARSHAAIERTVGEVVEAGAIPVVLGGDHSIAEPDIRACARQHGPLGLKEFAWQAEHGITSFFMHDVRELGIAAVLERTVEIVAQGPAFASVDVDVLDPAFAPGTGTPEPGGMTSGELLWACRTVAQRLELVGADVVEVIPTAPGSSDITALVADRIVRELLTGIALRRGG